MSESSADQAERTRVLRVLFATPVWTISNLLCLARLLLLPIVLYYLVEEEPFMALLVIGVGILTDLFDGFLARRLNSVSELGKILDPIVDKTTVIAILAFIGMRTLSADDPFPLILLFGTAFMFLIGLSYLIAFPFVVKKSGEVPTSNLPGKITGVFSGLVLILYVLEWKPWADVWMIITIGMTLASAVIYFLRDFHQRNKSIKIGWANRITLLRIVLSPLFLLIFFYDGNGDFDNNLLVFRFLALFLVVALVWSDRVDGVLARTRGEISDFGKLLDPFADKIALITVFLCFVATGWASAWMIALIYYREATVSFLRTLAATERIVLAAQPAGKIKTAIQSGVAITLLALSCLRELADVTGFAVARGSFFDAWDRIWLWLPGTLVFVVTLASVGSGIDYLWRNRKVIKSSLQTRPQSS